MAKISKKTIEELEDILNRGCDYADTQTVVDWDDKPICTAEEFANIFWDKAVEGILNVLKTQE